MSLSHGKAMRRILPRWRNSQRAASHTDFHSLKAPRLGKPAVIQQVREQVTEFSRNPNIGAAAELISAALLTNRIDEATEAADFILCHSENAPNTLIQQARSVVEKTSPFQSPVEPVLPIARTRQLLRRQPNNPALWSDMAQHHASFGDRHRALRCMKVAFALAPDHRWMLRTYARFLVHQEDAIAAHRLLVNHPSTRHDPWLIAAELACAQVAGRAPKFWRQAVDILRFDSVAPAHMSELATAVAMMELETGDRKRAKRYVQKGLVSPTENTLAQVFWAKENRRLNDGLGLEKLIESTNDTFEAECQMRIAQGDFLEAIEAARIWGVDEPFSARPCIDTAYIASLLDDYAKTIEMAEKVRKLDGRIPPSLELNAIFAQLSSGFFKVETNFRDIERVKNFLLAAAQQGDANSYHAIANLGLWFYRFGDVAVGHGAYQNAIANAQKNHLYEAAAMAATFAAREAILARTSNAATLLQEAKDLVAKVKVKAGEFYLRKLDALIAAPEDATKILSPTSAQQFLGASKSKLSRVRIDRAQEGGAILWVAGNGE